MFLRKDEKLMFPLGMYERPRDDGEWKQWSEAGINLVCCHSREHLDEAHRWGMLGWVPVAMVLADDDDGSALAERIDSLKDHPALAVWEAPDEAIWNAVYSEGERIPPRIWAQPADVQERAYAKLDAVVRGLERGSTLIRERDPAHRIWLNEAVLSSLPHLARCAPSLDVIGFDYYPAGVPDDNFARPHHLMGKDIDRFQQAAPGKEFWMVEQAFAFPDISKNVDGFPGTYPTLDEFRFMAWQAIAHQTTGLLWWGSAYVDRPNPMFDDLMTVVSEVAHVQDFLSVGPEPSVTGQAHHSWRASIMGCRCEARRIGDRTLVTMLNEDAHDVDMMIHGLDWIDPAQMKPMYEPSSPLTRLDGGYITPMAPYETRVYLV